MIQKMPQKIICLSLKNYLKVIKVVAIGEIGIDNYRNHSPQDIQKKVMIEQMDLAYKLNLPIVFHNRDADNEIFDVLKKHPFHKALSHCFSSNLDFAKKLILMESKFLFQEM